MPTQRGMLGRDWGIRLRGISETRFFLRNLEQELRGKRRREIAEKAIKMIQERTMAGKDIHSRRFAKKKDGSPATLYKTGKMLGALRYKFSGATIIIYVEGVDRREIVAEVHQYGMISGRRGARFKQVAREWFGLTKSQQQVLVADMTRELNLFIRRKATRF
jgi:phage gpG-like protein